MKRAGLIAVLLACCWAIPAFASEVMVSASSTTRTAAVEGLCRSAVEQAVQKIIGDRATQKKRDLLDASMYGSCSAYITEMKMSQEEKDETGAFQLAARATINDQLLREKLIVLGLIPPDRVATVAVFATERFLGNWVYSYFNSIADASGEPNECEVALGSELRDLGFSEVDMDFSSDERRAARSFRTVFGRYKDLSALPNNTAVRAAQIVDPNAVLVVSCRVLADVGDGKDSAFMYSACAEVSCKAVDTKSRRRVATASESKCFPHANRTTGSMAAIRAACSEIGKKMGKKLSGKYVQP